jgi:hypothetical protein
MKQPFHRGSEVDPLTDEVRCTLMYCTEWGEPSSTVPWLPSSFQLNSTHLTHCSYTNINTVDWSNSSDMRQAFSTLLNKSFAVGCSSELAAFCWSEGDEGDLFTSFIHMSKSATRMSLPALKSRMCSAIRFALRKGNQFWAPEKYLLHIDWTSARGSKISEWARTPGMILIESCSWESESKKYPAGNFPSVARENVVEKSKGFRSESPFYWLSSGIELLFVDA